MREEKFGCCRRGALFQENNSDAHETTMNIDVLTTTRSQWPPPLLAAAAAAAAKVGCNLISSASSSSFTSPQVQAAATTHSLFLEAREYFFRVKHDDRCSLLSPAVRTGFSSLLRPTSLGQSVSWSSLLLKKNSFS